MRVAPLIAAGCCLALCLSASAQTVYRNSWRYDPPAESFPTPRHLDSLRQEIRQNAQEASVRVDDLLRDHRDELVSVDESLLSISDWLDALPDADRKTLAEAYRRQYDPAARERLENVRRNTSARPEDFHAVWRRWPMASAGVLSLVEAADRALLLGDSASAAAYYELARRAGWQVDDERAVRLATCHWLSGHKAEPLAPAAGQKLAELARTPIGHRGPVPFDAVWYSRPERSGMGKILPIADDRFIYLVGYRHILCLRESGGVAWTWTPSMWSGKEASPDRAPNVGRGPVFAPALLAGAGGGQVLVARQPRTANREWCVRAFTCADGRLLWSTESDKTLDDLSFAGNPAVSGRFVYALAIDFGNAGALTLVALDVMEGRMLWKCAMGSFTDMQRNRASRGGYDSFWDQAAPLVVEDLVCLTPNVGRAMAVGRFDGKLRWVRGYLPAKAAPAKPGPNPGFEDPREAAPASPAIQTRWSNTPAASGAWGAAPMLLCAAQDHPSVFALDLRQGRLLWQDNDPQAPTLIGAATDTAIFAGSFVHGVDPSSGRTRWRYSPPAGTTISGPPVIHGDLILVPQGEKMGCISAGNGTNAPLPARLGPSFRRLLANEAARKAMDEALMLKTFGLPQ